MYKLTRKIGRFYELTREFDNLGLDSFDFGFEIVVLGIHDLRK
jgi:hypothetical protein